MEPSLLLLTNRCHLTTSRHFRAQQRHLQMESDAVRGVEQHLLFTRNAGKAAGGAIASSDGRNTARMPARGAIFGPLQPPPEKNASRGSQVEFDGPKSSAVNPLIPSDGDRAWGFVWNHCNARKRPHPSAGRFSPASGPAAAWNSQNDPCRRTPPLTNASNTTARQCLRALWCLFGARGSGRRRKRRFSRAVSVGLDCGRPDFQKIVAS